MVRYVRVPQEWGMDRDSIGFVIPEVSHGIVVNQQRKRRKRKRRQRQIMQVVELSESKPVDMSHIGIPVIE